jgi:RNA polymerase sigma-70 factor (ECF subfamily)
MEAAGVKRFDTNLPARGAELNQFERIYRESAGQLRRIAIGIVGDREAALDAVQQGFSIAVHRRESFRGEGPLEAWVWRIVVNEARDTRSRLRARSDAERSEAVVDAVLAEREPAPDEPILRALAELPERQRLVVFLRFFADLDYAAIARVLEISEGTVGSTLNQAQSRLRELLEEVQP